MLSCLLLRSLCAVSYSFANLNSLHICRIILCISFVSLLFSCVRLIVGMFHSDAKMSHCGFRYKCSRFFSTLSLLVLVELVINGTLVTRDGNERAQHFSKSWPQSSNNNDNFFFVPLFQMGKLRSHQSTETNKKIRKRRRTGNRNLYIFHFNFAIQVWILNIFFPICFVPFQFLLISFRELTRGTHTHTMYFYVNAFCVWHFHRYIRAMWLY